MKSRVQHFYSYINKFPLLTEPKLFRLLKIIFSNLLSEKIDEIFSNACAMCNVHVQDVVSEMIRHDPNILEQADIDGRTALMWAAGKGANGVIQLLLGLNNQEKETQNGSGMLYITTLREYVPAYQSKSDLLLYSLYYAEKCNELTGSISSSLHLQATQLLPKKYLSGGELLAAPCLV